MARAVAERANYPDGASCDGKSQEEGLIVAYLDGELAREESETFERHVAACSRCARDLAEQRRVLCALSLALKARPDVALPRDFSQIVIARAQSDMRGVRRRGERRLALKICLGLMACAALLFGAASAATAGVASLARSALGGLRPLAGVLWMIWRAAADAASGVAVVLRAVGRQLLFDSHVSGVAVLLLFAAALMLLPLLIINYHRDARSAE